jgi:hypothetical protein
MVFSMLPVSALATNGESTDVTNNGDTGLSVTDQPQEGSAVPTADEPSTVAVDGYLYVNCDYNSSTEGYGVTKFSNYAGAYAYATANNTSATIVIEKTNTLSGNTFDNNHKNYSRLAVVIEDGATMGNAASKWDMTYPVTVKAGGKLTCARPLSASVSYIHIKNTLTVGEAGSDKKAVVDFLSDSYQDCDISIRYNGKVIVNNADFKVQDLDAQGAFTITNSNVYIDGAFASATSLFYATTLNNSTMTVKGNQISGGISDFAGGTSNQLGNVKLNNSSLMIESGATKVTANVTATNSDITVNNLTVNTGKTVNLNEGSTLATTGEAPVLNGTAKVMIDGEKAVLSEDGTFVPAPSPIAQIGDKGFATLADAIAAAQDGETIVLLSHIEVSQTVVVPAGKTITLNLNGKSITSTVAQGFEAVALTNSGNLTITGKAPSPAPTVLSTMIWMPI